MTYATYDWVPRAPEIHSRAEVERQTGPYDAAVTPPIAAWSPIISSEDSANVEDATRQLVEFDHHAQRKIGTGNLALGPMTAILLRIESASSSQIEQLTTSAKQLALAEIDEEMRADFVPSRSGSDRAKPGLASPNSFHHITTAYPVRSVISSAS